MELKRNEMGDIIFRNPKWTTKDTIEVEVEHDVFGWIPFNATADDDVEHGRELYALISYNYAESIVACTQEERDAEQIDEILTSRSRLLKESDWITLNDVQLENQNEWLIYRQALRDITDQPGYPWEVTFPEKPQLTSNTFILPT